MMPRGGSLMATTARGILAQSTYWLVFLLMIVVIGFANASEDSDGDGVSDKRDNCPMEPNAGQTNADDDRLGDLCDPCPVWSNWDCEPMRVRKLAIEPSKGKAEMIGFLYPPDGRMGSSFLWVLLADSEGYLINDIAFANRPTGNRKVRLQNLGETLTVRLSRSDNVYRVRLSAKHLSLADVHMPLVLSLSSCSDAFSTVLKLTDCRLKGRGNKLVCSGD